MKFHYYSTLILGFLVNASAHPSAAEHSHPHGEAWPFPPIQWIIIAVLLGSILYQALKYFKKTM